jgi:hypothetical protein
VNVLTASATTVQRIPVNAKLLHVEEQGQNISMWFEVNTHLGLVERRFQFYVTGVEIPAGLVYIGTATFNAGELVLHVYEVLS